MFPLQFPTDSSKQVRTGNGGGFEQQPTRDSSRDVSGNAARRHRDRERLDAEIERGEPPLPPPQQCQCRNCQMERKYLKKKRKREERIHWND